MPGPGLSDLLLVEIGGTHTRCAVARDDDQPAHIVVFNNVEHPDLEAVIAAYLAETTVPPPRRAGLAVAAPVDAGPLHMTNLGWTVDTEHLAQRFGWRQADVVNDFEALACAVPVLSADELSTIRPGVPRPGVPVAVLGPGTGLGVSGLLPCGNAWFPVRGEGGHVTLAAANNQEEEVLRALRSEHGHVSAERVLSGPGILNLYRVVAGGSRADSPTDVTRLADAGDEQALAALDLFFHFLGTVCSDLVLTLGARGGVYLGGGILPTMAARLKASGFTRRFVDKGRYSEYLDEVPVYLITADTPALRGLLNHPLLNRR